MNVEKVCGIMSKPETLEKLDSIEDIKDLQNYISENGEEIGAAELEEIIHSIGLLKSGEEIDETDLDNVSGGVGIYTTVKWCIKAGKWGMKVADKYYAWEKKHLRI